MMSPHSAIDRDELNSLLGLYLCKATDIPIKEDLEGRFDATSALYQIIEPELRELSTVADRDCWPSVAMWVTDCLVRASAVAMNAAPSEAIRQITQLVKTLKPRLGEDLKDLHRTAA
jgi:hypothetical protein